MNTGLSAVVSSHGVSAVEAGTVLGCQLFGMAVDGDKVGSFAIAAHSQRSPAGFADQLRSFAADFRERTLSALNPQSGTSYQGRVLLTPEAVQSLFVGNLSAMMNAAAIRKGKSPFAESLGQRIVSEQVVLSDQCLTPGAFGAGSFDREGLPREELTLIEKGVFKEILYNSFEARLAQHPGGSNGHARGGAGALPQCGPSRLVLNPGSEPLSAMLENDENCILVTRFSGSTNAITGEFSGVVKSGFQLRDGERVPLKETLIAGNLLDMFTQVVAISQETEVVYGHTPYPYVLVDGVSVTAG